MLSFRERALIGPPYRLLALDGGGIRGVLTLEILREIEAVLRQASGDERLVLAEWFDYIAGTSTGAIIAVGLAQGMSVSAISDLYSDLGASLFRKSFAPRRLWNRYRSEPVAAALKDAFGKHTTFGDASLRTLLMVVLRNASTDSPWPLSNNPAAKFNNSAMPGSNLEFPLWQLVRASTAAPVFFPAERIEMGGRTFYFEDGGVTSFNNPALQLFLMATLDRYRLGWRPSVDDMLLVSVGTGFNPKANANLKLSKLHLLHNAQAVPSALMFAAQTQQDALCRVLGKTVVGGWLDEELDQLIPATGVVSDPLFTYMRFNAELSPDGLRKLGLTGIDPDAVARLDSVEHIEELRAIGRAVAGQVKENDLKPFLNPIRR